jgi:protein SCO1
VPRGPLALRIAVPLLVGGVVALAGCGGGGGGATSAAAGADHPRAAARTAPPAAGDFRGGTLTPRRPAPPLALRDVDGRLVRLADQRGKAALVTFVYTHCPDVCPLIIDHLKLARERLGATGRRLALIAVSVDPEGDTRAAVRRFLRRHGVTGTVDYLIGSRPQLERTWARWGVASRVDRANPDLVEHSAFIYGIGASGRLTTLYPLNMRVADIAHDVPLLLRS